ncbi:hypothetical protein JOF28_000429 [Leucobacter exalbidus]|uniref:DUF3071 domain-containing protein n=1 Tax=Leucobacter exalbidus TaxID=662960 RepID=A0A940PR97_9MICO|nr:septation protein SepH [Leucobacter exalbidus]MBP1325197.1 hypothetical protein [Leucobacter exalbidus]
MNELRFVRREERSLILANASDDEFRLVIDDLLMSELKHASRKERETGRVRPREIQSLVRAGKSRAEIAAMTGLEEADIERYEEPVLAERRYILDRAHAIPVRTDANDDSDQQFGAVIAERLIVLEAEATDWSAWRDEETGWLISLEFISRDVAHRALWSFDHRKQTLAPINSDAVSMSKQGDVGDRLIPKLRAVDNGDRTSQFAEVSEPQSDSPAQSRPAPAPLTPAVAAADRATAAQSTTPAQAKPEAKSDSKSEKPAGDDAAQTRPKPAAAPHAPAAVASPAAPPAAPVNNVFTAARVNAEQPAKVAKGAPVAPAPLPKRISKPAAPLDANAEYARRREIDQRAIKSDDSGPVDFSQTADLLDALRRRRGERKLAEVKAPDNTDTTPIQTPAQASQPTAPRPEAPATVETVPADAAPLRGLKKSRSIWGGAGVASGVTPDSLASDSDTSRDAQAAPAEPAAPAQPKSLVPVTLAATPALTNVTAAPPADAAADARAPKKGRASIPSWDDILFGTRSDEDPAT